MDQRKKIKRSQKQEKRGMKSLGGYTHSGSGSGWARKGDGSTETELVEFKRTDNKKQITLKAQDLEKIRTEALIAGRIPLLGFELAGRNYIVMSEDDYVASRVEDIDAGRGS